MTSYNGFPPEQRERAQRWLVKQWNSGAVPRPSKCCACGQTKGIIHAHAEDYSEPFGENLLRYPLCYRCHITLHCRFKNKEGWTRFIRLLHEGWSWVPLLTPSFGLITSFMNGNEEPTIPGPPRTKLIFDTMLTNRIHPEYKRPVKIDLQSNLSL